MKYAMHWNKIIFYLDLRSQVGYRLMAEGAKVLGFCAPM